MATRAENLKQRYGITLVDYDRMLEEQDCKCKICGSKDRLVVDHCHDKGHVRGLLVTIATQDWGCLKIPQR